MENVSLTTDVLETVCKKYDLPVFENPKDNLIMIITSNKPTYDEKCRCLDIYEDYLLDLYDAI